MNVEQIGIWSDIAEIIASVATVGALIAVIFEVRKAKLNENREIVFETQKMWRDLSQTLQREREMHWEDFEDFQQKYSHGDQVRLRDFFDILNFFEMISQLVQLGTLDEEIMVDMWGSPAIFYYVRYKHILEGYREEFGSAWFEKIDWLANKAMIQFPELSERFSQFSENQMQAVKISEDN